MGMRWRFGRDRRGVSAVISTILMIMVAMIGMSILFGYVVIYTDNYKAGAGSSVLEHLTVEDVWVKSSNTLQITVYNSGKRENLGAQVDFQVATIFVDGVALTNDNSSSLNYGSINFNEQIVKAGGHFVFLGRSSQASQNFNLGSHQLKIVTVRGSHFETMFTGP